MEVRKNILARISNWGVTSDLTPVFAKRIILTNMLGLAFGINMIVSTVAFFLLGRYQLSAFAALFVLSEFSWPLFNKYGHYDISRVGILISSNLLGFLTSIMLPETGYNRGFFVMAGLPILIFSLKERWFILLGYLLPIFLYPLAEWAELQVPREFVLTEGARAVIHFGTGTIYVTMVFMMFLFLSRENSRAEDKLASALMKVEAEKRTIEALNEELEGQRARAFSSAKFAALGEMASGIAHEINNPMAAIHLTTEQLKLLLRNKDTDDEVIYRKLDNILNTVRRVAKIIEAMRTFSREGTNDALQSESLRMIIDETLAICSERFRNRSIEIAVDYQSDPILFRCRAVQVAQVVLNLLNNSFDAIEVLPEKWIKIEARKTDSEVIITVTDSGSGVPVADQDKIFQPFFTTKAVGKGTGLGLSLSRKIVEDHGGSIVLDRNCPNTRFIITLPV